MRAQVLLFSIILLLSCFNTTLAASPSWSLPGIAGIKESVTKLRMPDRLTKGLNTSTTSFCAAANCAGVKAASAVSEKPSKTRLAGMPPAIVKLRSVKRVTFDCAAEAVSRSTAAYRLPSLVLTRTRQGPTALTGTLSLN